MFGFGYCGNSFWPLGGVLNILFWGFVICTLAYLLNESSKSSSAGSKKQDEAIDILRKRYASGEINAEEFAQKKKDLEF